MSKSKKEVQTQIWQQSGNAGVKVVTGVGTVDKICVGGVATSFPVQFSADLLASDYTDGADSSVTNYTINSDSGVVYIDWLGEIKNISQASGTVAWIYA